jgi:serine/threonine protein kinase
MKVPQTEVILRHEGAELARVTLPPGEYVIGRGPEVDIFANTPLLALQHARLMIDSQRLLLQDLGSSKGTYVAEHRITEFTQLLPDQEVRLGDIELEVHRGRALSDSGQDSADNPAPIRRYLPDELLSQNRYAIHGVVAQGGMGAILDAHEGPTQRTVAMKVMLETASEEDVHRFIEEARVTAQLEHPNIVPVHELGVDQQDRLYYTMKMVRGITLHKVLDLMASGMEATIRKYPLATLLTLFQKACDAIAFAHSRGVIHRDLKPENLMLGDFGEVLVMDWGVAKIVGQGAQPSAASRETVASARAAAGDFSGTLQGTILGTPYYMPPEQAAGDTEHLDFRCDIYALGAILFEMLYLRRTVLGETLEEILENVRAGRVQWSEPNAAATVRRTAKPVSHLPGGRVPPSLRAVCQKALSFDREQRYASVADFQADLEAYQRGFAPSAETVTPFKTLVLFARRHQTACIAAALVVLTVLAFGTKALVEARRAQREGERATRALADLRRAAPTFAAQARALVEQHRFDEALTTLTTASTLDPYNADYRLQQGHIHQTLQRFAEAEAAYREALQREPLLPLATQNIILSQSLAREAALGPEDAKRAQARLQSELIKQARTDEAVFLAKTLASDATRNLATWKPVIEKLGLKTDATHLRARPDGTLLLFIEDGTFSDLRPLRGMPLGELIIKNTAVQDLSPLKGMPLARVDASNNPQITDISALRELPLRTLLLATSGIQDLSALRGMKLVELYATRVSGSFADLSPLAGMPLESVTVTLSGDSDTSVFAGMPLKVAIFYGTMKGSLDFLRDAPLTRLRVDSSTLDDLSPLEGKALTSLQINNAKITDLGPLRGMPLNELRLTNTTVVDLSPIAGLPIRTLFLTGSKKIRDLEPVLSLTSLESLVLPEGDYDLEPLRKLPNLKRLSHRVTGDTFSPAQTVEEFWREFDAAKGKEAP